VNEVYITEKIEAYNVAIEALRMHEGANDVPGLSLKLRIRLATKLDRELQRWCDKRAL